MVATDFALSVIKMEILYFVMLLRLARACPNMDKIRRGVCRLSDCFSGTRIRQ